MQYRRIPLLAARRWAAGVQAAEVQAQVGVQAVEHERVAALGRDGQPAPPRALRRVYRPQGVVCWAGGQRALRLRGRSPTL